jgi:hypothetical protein
MVRKEPKALFPPFSYFLTKKAKKNWFKKIPNAQLIKAQMPW